MTAYNKYKAHLSVEEMAKHIQMKRKSVLDRIREQRKKIYRSMESWRGNKHE